MQGLKKYCVLLVVAAVLGSAQQAPAPAVLSSEQMVAILVDLELAKALVQHYGDDEATTSAWCAYNVEQVYQAHSTTLEAFQASYEHYCAHPETLQAIYGMVIEQLEALWQQL